jgi:hypothetical protein
MGTAASEVTLKKRLVVRERPPLVLVVVNAKRAVFSERERQIEARGHVPAWTEVLKIASRQEYQRGRPERSTEHGPTEIEDEHGCRIR